jgi:hypothetical protein
VAAAAGGVSLSQSFRPSKAEQAIWAAPEDVLIIGRSPAALARFKGDARWRATNPNLVRPWTDDYTNLAGALYANLKHRFNPRAQP